MSSLRCPGELHPRWGGPAWFSLLLCSWSPMKSHRPAWAKNAIGFVQKRLRSSEILQIVACAILGSAIGAFVAMLRRTVDWLHTIGFRLPSGAFLSAGVDVNPLSIIFLPVTGGLVLGIAALAMRHFGSGEIVDPIEANALHGGRMSLFDSCRLLTATVFSNAVGGAVGMEAGYSQIGACMFSAVGQVGSLRRADLRIFVGAGAAAAIAAAFNAPLAGAFYGFELIIGSYAISALAPVALAALVAALTERALISPEPLFAVAQGFHFKESVYLLFGVLGVVSAGFSVLAMQTVTWSERMLRKLPAPQWLRPAVGGILLSLVAVLVPQVLGSGHGAVQELFDGNVSFEVLCLLLIAKLLASAVSLGSGFRGGMFSASLLLGTLFGGVFADVSAFFIPRLAAQHTALMMVGMGSVAAGIVGAPLTIVFLILEGTGDFPMTVAVTVGVVISSTLVRVLFGYSFSTWRFHQRGLSVRSPHDIGWLADLTVGRLMRQDVKTVPASMLIAAVREKYPLGAVKRLFVVSSSGGYCGMLEMTIIHDGRQNTDMSATAGELAGSADLVLRSFENVRTALAIFDKHQIETLPVVELGSGSKVIGYLTEHYALRRYNQELERRRSAELGERDLFSVAEPPPRK